MDITLTTILISVLTGSLSAATVSGIFSVYSQKKDYKNEYFKYIVKRRIEVYEIIENVIGTLKGSVYDDVDAKCCHMVFARGYDYFLEKK